MTPNKPTVVLLHGLLRTERSMAGLRRAIDAAGYPTWACTYPSREIRVQDAARYVSERLAAEAPGPLLGVTHSMGAILVRHMRELPWKGLVMLAPPNTGSGIANRLRNQTLFRWIYGPAGQQMAGSPEHWPVPEFPCGVIAGTRALALTNPTSWLTVGLGLFARGQAHDGTVAVDETRLPGLAAFATVDANHTWIMNHPETRRLVLHFLESGSFGPVAEDASAPVAP